MIKLSNITKVFQQGNRSIQALNNVSLHVPAGQIYGVIGASGAGKSTLIRCVNLLERPTEGSVQVDGQELTALSEKELTRARRQIGMIFQHFNLLASRTVFGNVALPRSWITRRRLKSNAVSRSCWILSVWVISTTATRPTSPAARNSAWRLPARWPAILKYCCAMKPPAPGSGHYPFHSRTAERH
nr:Methionine import ATP-binding protein MetN [Klebsiella pneumoniae]